MLTDAATRRGAAGAAVRRLRSVPSDGARARSTFAAGPRASVSEPAAATQRIVGHVLVAGSDAGARTRVLEELRSLLPHGTELQEASEAWELVARAPGSRMVVLAGELSSVSTGSLERLLARRHPGLPVLAMADGPRADGLPVDTPRSTPAR